MNTNNQNNQSPNGSRSVYTLKHLIIGDTPAKQSNIITNLYEVAIILEVESKSTAQQDLFDIFNTNIDIHKLYPYLKQLFLYGLILDHHYDTETQKHTFFHDTLFNEIGDYEQSSLMYLDKSNDCHRYDISTIHNTVETQTESDVYRI